MIKKFYTELSRSIILASFIFLFSALPVGAQGSVLGIHILSPQELKQAVQLLENKNNNHYQYITIPFSLDDLNKKQEWRNFFDQANNLKIKPIVRLVTKFENNAWQIPTRKNITDQISFLNSLAWPEGQKTIIIYNEVNHAPEWGGQIDPISYAQTLKFAYQWAKSEDPNFVVLPAALDLAASNTSKTQESFLYLNNLLAYEPEIFNYIDNWNSHSYPNPGFSSSPTRTSKNSLRGYQHELEFIKNKTGKDFKVFITETGWVENNLTQNNLENYYDYALKNIWSDERILAVTPFILNGAPGPFSKFSFLDQEGKPTRQYLAFRKALENLKIN